MGAINGILMRVYAVVGVGTAVKFLALHNAP